MKGYTMMKNKENIIGFDFQGWPVRKLTLEEILVKLGARLNPETCMYEIDKSLVETTPTVYTDDGMGYGVNEAYIVDADRNEADECTVWIDAADKNIDIYLEDEVYPGMSIVTPESRMYVVETYVPETGRYRVREFPEGARNFLPAEFIDREIVLDWIRKGENPEE
jgi:hypothetical protein